MLPAALRVAGVAADIWRRLHAAERLVLTRRRRYARLNGHLLNRPASTAGGARLSEREVARSAPQPPAGARAARRALVAARHARRERQLARRPARRLPREPRLAALPAPSPALQIAAVAIRIPAASHEAGRLDARGESVRHRHRHH